MFNKTNASRINALPDEYKNAFIQSASRAIEDYVSWINKNAKGFRFSHFFHGNTGKERADTLLKMIKNDKIEFSNKVIAVNQTIRESGFYQHSLKRYIYQYMNNDKKEDVMNDRVRISSDRFIDKYYKSLEEQVKKYKQAITSQSLDKVSFWCLIAVADRSNQDAMKNNNSYVTSKKRIVTNNNRIDDEDTSSFSANNSTIDFSTDFGFFNNDGYYGYSEPIQSHDFGHADFVAHIGH